MTSQPISNKESFYRIALNKKHVDLIKKRFTSYAFMLKAASATRAKEKDLSVDMVSRTTPQESRARFKKTYGISILKSLNIRSLSEKNYLIDIEEQEIEDFNPAHCGITGLPHSEDDIKMAERYAHKLQQISNWVECEENE